MYYVCVGVAMVFMWEKSRDEFVWLFVCLVGRLAGFYLRISLNIEQRGALLQKSNKVHEGDLSDQEGV